MNRGGTPPRKRTRREVAAETETEAEAEHIYRSRCWLLDRVEGEPSQYSQYLAERDPAETESVESIEESRTPRKAISLEQGREDEM